MRNDLISKAKKLEPLLRVGKDGLTEGVVKEIQRQLRQKKLIKIKFFKSALGKTDKKQVFSGLADATGSEIVLQVGFVLVLYKR